VHADFKTYGLHPRLWLLLPSKITYPFFLSKIYVISGGKGKYLRCNFAPFYGTGERDGEARGRSAMSSTEFSSNRNNMQTAVTIMTKQRMF